MENKRELSNTRRLESLKERQRERVSFAKHIKTSIQNLDTGGTGNKKIVFQSDDSDEDPLPSGTVPMQVENGDAEAKLSLFASDEEDDDDNTISHQFRVRSQYQGPKGSRFLQENSEALDQRFRLNEHFAEDFEEVDAGRDEDSNEETEKDKNLAILEKVLGHQVFKKAPNDPTGERKKKYVRFNPEDENSWKYSRKTEPEKEEIKCKEPEPAPEVSSERYFEVDTDLKSILEETKDKFSLTQTFGFSLPVKEENFMADVPKESQNKTVQSVKPPSLSLHIDAGNVKHQRFFIIPGDARLTEGVEFFKRDKPMEEIRENFFKTRDAILEMFKTRKKRFSVGRNKNKR